jgi:dolichyl-phosphate beta-glucosyltransferase
MSSPTPERRFELAPRASSAPPALDARPAPALSIVIPAYNEARRLGTTLEAALAYLDESGIAAEVIVVDDGSSDRTAEVVLEFGRLDARVTLLRLEQNRGKGYAVRAGVLSSRGARVLFMDADLSTPMAELASLQRAIDDGHDVAVGSRARQGAATTVQRSALRKLMGRSFNAFVRVVALGGIGDTQCGFKLFTRRSARFLFGAATIDRFAFDVEILLLARGRFSVAEVPVAWKHVAESKVSPVRDAVSMAVDLLALRVRHASAQALAGLRRTPAQLPAPAE